ncbi:MAG: acetate--CoA ligase family protein [Candidatus Micrarchaeia archaeon]|jgi:acetyl coenzyme A synthetase (ADP forming)-like protein
MNSNLKFMLKPKSVAIIGASRVPGKAGRVILENYINTGYSGKLYPVNPNAENLLGLKAYAHVSEIKGNIDLAVIAVPAPVVPEVLEECGKKKVKSAVVISGGFAEVGNKELQDKIVKIAEKYNIAMLGPNCLGVLDTRSRVNTLFLPAYKLSEPKVGYVSFVSQSGAVGSTVLDVIEGEGFGLSKFFSYGNAAAIDETDILNYLLKDEETKVVVMYIEGIKRGAEFVKVAKKISMKKPVIVLKAGRTSAGANAAHSHTASLAGNYAVQEAIFKQFGFTVAEDLEDLITYAKIFSLEEETTGNNVAVITNGGGTGVLTADEIGSSGKLKLAEFSEETKEALRKAMPPIVNIADPLDLAGDADAERFGKALELVSRDPNVDMIIAIVLFQTPGADSTVAAEIIKQKNATDKPVVVISPGSSYTAMQKIMMESGGVPVYDSPASAVKALTALLGYSNYRKRKTD